MECRSTDPFGTAGAVSLDAPPQLELCSAAAVASTPLSPASSRLAGRRTIRKNTRDSRDFTVSRPASGSEDEDASSPEDRCSVLLGRTTCSSPCDSQTLDAPKQCPSNSDLLRGSVQKSVSTSDLLSPERPTRRPSRRLMTPLTSFRLTVGEQEATSPASKHSKHSGKSCKSVSTPVSNWSMPSLRRENSVYHPEGKLSENYTEVKLLGKGGFGTVMECQDKRTGATWAVKSIPPAVLEEVGCIEKELSISRRMKHPNVVKVHEIFKDDHGVHLVMEAYTGCDLGKYIDSNPYEDLGPGCIVMGLSSEDAGMYIWQMLSGASYLHYHKIVHRDMKAENYLLETPNERAPLKLVDFGLARFYDERKTGKMNSLCGTSYTMAPEVVIGNFYTEKCDIWSIGILAYMASVGYAPFCGDSDEEILSKVKSKEVAYDKADWSRHAPELQPLVLQMLTREVSMRPSARQSMKSSSWLARQGRRGVSKTCCVVT
eukprot:TRINITY_DN81077_c0_g1_i1.p1 TRINITY_DN81077_c0_g1~~TRINITY_DN81077_c0_g1_i1.p1  ORF type:complete len:487 (+),score=88.62 TRINITY_DN81077_c0_g1_i1:71-1531(+)